MASLGAAIGRVVDGTGRAACRSRACANTSRMRRRERSVRRCGVGLVGVGVLAACHVDAPCVELDVRNDAERVLCNDLGEPVLARVAVPPGPAPAQGWPGIVLLHGSSGLYRPNTVATAAATGEACSEQLHMRFAEWEALLIERGYAVIMPASFASRGFCDADEDPVAAVPGADDDYVELERLVARSHDAAAAARWLCADPRVDCGRLAALGFSNGASVALMVLHEDPSDAADPRLQALDRPRFAGGVAYYPGCGLETQLAHTLDPAERERFYFPTGPIWVPHAGKDPLLDACKQLRDPQVADVAALRKVASDRFDLRVFGEAKHGFDGWQEGEPSSDRWARDQAQTETLARLDAWLRP